MEDIINLFTKEHGVYKQIFKFHVIILFILLLFVLTRIGLLGNSVYILLAFVFTIYLTNMYVKVNQNDLNDNNKIIHIKLETIQSKIYEYVNYKIAMSISGGLKLPPSDIQKLYEKNRLNSMYIDANLIVFLHSILNLYEYNPHEFYLLVKGTNNILKLKHDIERFYEAEGQYPENIHEMLQVAIQLKSNCMNNLQNFIYSVPKQNKMYTYVDNILVAYNILVTRNIKKMHNYHLDYIRKNGINNSTIFIDIHGSKHFDPLTNKSVIPGKEGLKPFLIDLYP